MIRKSSLVALVAFLAVLLAGRPISAFHGFGGGGGVSRRRRLPRWRWLWRRLPGRLWRRLPGRLWRDGIVRPDALV